VPLLVAAAVWAIAVAGGVATLRDKTLAR